MFNIDDMDPSDQADDYTQVENYAEFLEEYEDYEEDPYSGSKNAWKPPTGIHPSINLPLAFKIYYNKMFTFSNFYIAHEEGRKLHAVSGHSKRLIGPGETKLHSGPEPTSPVLGSALIDYKKIEVRLTGGTLVLHEIKESIWKKLESSSSKNEFHFDFPILGFPVPERFEWRRSKGPEVKSLNGPGGHAWVLLRIRHGALEQPEPVAVSSVDAASTKVAGRFAFLNSGATSELGADFAITAVVSALSLGYLRREAYTVKSVLELGS